MRSRWVVMGIHNNGNSSTREERSEALERKARAARDMFATQHTFWFVSTELLWSAGRWLLSKAAPGLSCSQKIVPLM